MKLQTQDPASIPGEALRKSEENFRDIFENAPVGIYQSTIYRLVAANPALARMFGYHSPAEMAASVEIPGELFVKSDQERALVREAMESETVVQRQVEFLRKDGSTFPAHLRMKAVRNEEGKLKFIYAFVENLTECQRAEDERLKMLWALEQSPVDIVITDLAGNLASKAPPMSFG
jgi:PAS domain S-box-containing protein